MNADKLARAAKKELTRNPKKTIALGLVTLVAVWFWVPLAWKWLGGDASKAKSRKAAQVAAKVENALPSNTSKAGEIEPEVVPSVTKVDWEELLSRMARDPRMQTAALVTAGRDPFLATNVEKQAVAEANAVEAENGNVSAVAAPVELTPENVGLVLQGTLITSRNPQATINGKAYGVGDKVTVKADATGSARLKDTEFEVLEIAPRRVVLRHENRTYEVILGGAALAEGDVLKFGSQASSR